MIPTVLLPAFLIGRFWVIPVLVAAWVLMMRDVPGCNGECLWATTGLALINSTVGIGAHRIAVALYRVVRAHVAR